MEVCSTVERSGDVHLSSLSTDASGQLDVLGHDGDPLGVDGAEVGVLEQSHEIGLCSLLESHHGGTLEPQEPLEPPDLSEGNSAWSVTMGLLDSSSGWGRLPGSLGGELLPWGLSSGGLAGSLLGSCHVERSGNTDDSMSCRHVFIGAIGDLDVASKRYTYLNDGKQKTAAKFLKVTHTRTGFP